LAKGHSNFCGGMKKKFSFAIILFIGGIILTVGISSSAIWEAYRGKKIENEVEKLKQEAQRVQNENNTIQQRISYYSTPQFVERVSKDKMNMQKPDENVVIVDQEKAVQQQISENRREVAQTEQAIPNYKKWWNFFFKYN
jgi:cell division protein FtsL